jgi:hypothetical protein
MRGGPDKRKRREQAKARSAAALDHREIPKSGVRGDRIAKDFGALSLTVFECFQ